MTVEAVALVATIVLIGLFVLLLFVALAAGQRRSGRDLRRVEGAARAIRHELSTPAERAARVRRRRRIEARNREIHGRFNSDGT